MKGFRKIFFNNQRQISGIFAGIFIVILCWFVAPAFSSSAPSSLALFDRVWETVDRNFYDPKFNGVDWQALRKKYRAQIAASPSAEPAAIAINQMLSELRASHTRLYTPEEPSYYQALGIFQPRLPELQQQLKPFFPNGKIEYSDIGIFTRNVGQNQFVSAILDGSPAVKAGLLVGDRLLSANGQPFHPIRSFSGKAGQAVTLLFQRQPDSSSLQTIQVTPLMMDAATMFLDAQKASTQIFERSGKTIGYTHIWSYAGEQYQRQLEKDLLYGRLKDTDALVLDLREGWGGAPMTALNIYSRDRNLSLTNRHLPKRNG
jgi:carboxyl-terminal processing protease